MSFIQRLLRSVYSNIRSGKQVFFASIGSITVALSILGLFLFVYVNLNSFLDYWSRQVQLIVYLDDKVPAHLKKDLESFIKTIPDLQEYEFISRQEAWSNFQSLFSEKTEFLKELDFNPLPASFNIQFRPSAHRLEKIKRYAAIINDMKGVESVEYGEKWIGRFEAFMMFLRVFLFALGALLTFGAVMIISNTIKLSMFSKKDEIELMLLIGATPRFIKAPYLVEGILYGFLGACVSILLVKGIQLYLKYQFQGSLGNLARGIEFQFISQPYLLIIFIASAGVGLMGSYISIRQFLNLYTRN